MKYLIYGAGNTGFAAHVFLQQKGVKSLIYTRQEKKAVLYRERGLKVSGKIEGHFPVDITADLSEAVQQTDHILVFTRANAHRDVLRALKPLIKPRSMILFVNGNWGGYQALQELKESVEEKNLLIGETAAQVFMTSLSSPEELSIHGIKGEVACACYPSEGRGVFSDLLRELFGGIFLQDSLIVSSLSSTNPAVHVPIVLTNLTKIGRSGSASFYPDGVSETNMRLVERLDQERMAVARSLGLNCPDVLQSLNRTWGRTYSDLGSALVDLYPYGGYPETLEHRYFTEDIPFGIASVAHLARSLGGKAQVSEALLDVLEVLLKRDFRSEAVRFEEEIVKRLL